MSLRACLGVCALALLCGCGHRLTDKDLVGVWQVDPSTVSEQNATLAQGATLSLAADHQFVLTASPSVQVKGAWGLTEQKVIATPATLAIQSPFQPGKTVQMPVPQAIEALKPALQPGQAHTLDALGQPFEFEVSADGKTLTSKEKVTLRKGPSS